MSRLLFAKQGRAKYISHLDLMATFQRAFQRARLDLAHAAGCNPPFLWAFPARANISSFACWIRSSFPR